MFGITKNSLAIDKVGCDHSTGNLEIGQTKIVVHHFGVNLPASHFGGEDGEMTDLKGQNGRNLNEQKKGAFVDCPNLRETAKTMEPNFDDDGFGHLLAIESNGIVVGYLSLAFHFVVLIEIEPMAKWECNDGHDFVH